jgi:hypothetical protein
MSAKSPTMKTTTELREVRFTGANRKLKDFFGLVFNLLSTFEIEPHIFERVVN